MAFIPIALDDVKEGEAVAEGQYEVQIVKVEDGESKQGNAMTTVTMKILDTPNAATVRHWLTYPNSKTPSEQIEMRKLDILRFLVAFGFSREEVAGGFDSADLQGRTAVVTLTQEEANDDSGNIYNRLRLPRLPR